MEASLTKNAKVGTSGLSRLLAKLRTETIRAFELYADYCQTVAETHARRLTSK